jgi:hypothetical protein
MDVQSEAGRASQRFSNLPCLEPALPSVGDPWLCQSYLPLAVTTLDKPQSIAEPRQPFTNRGNDNGR